MEFEALKVIWDSQNQEHLYAVNEASLHSIVRRRNRQFHRRASVWQYREIATGIVFGLLMIGLAGMLALGDPRWLDTLSWINIPVSPWHVTVLGVAAGIWLCCAAYIFRARRRQLQREGIFESSLRGEIDRTLDHVDFQIGISRRIVWSGYFPDSVAAALWVGVTFHLMDVKLWAYGMAAAMMTVGFALSVWWQYRAISRQFEPRRKELEALREKMQDRDGSK